MRRKIAGLLAIVLLVSVFQGLGVPTFAAEVGRATGPILYEELNHTILYEGQTYVPGKDGTLRSDEVVLKIPMQKEGIFQEGNYTLTYYIVEEDEVKPVTATFNTQGLNKPKIDVEISIDKVVKDTTSIARDKATGSNANGHRVNIAGIGQVMFYMEDSALYYSTSGIKKGILTPFTLSYTGDFGDKTDKRNVFKGVEEMDILPTHLLTDEEKKNINAEYLDKDKMSLPSLNYIPYTTTPGAIQHKAGSRPGFVATFKTPQIINEVTNTLEKVNKDTQAELVFAQKYGNTPLSHKVKFGMEENQDIYSGSGVPQPSGHVVENGDRLEVYISKDRIREEEYIWEELQNTMILEASLNIISGKGFGKNELAGEVTKEKLNTPAQGNTYIEYNVFRTSEGHITFDIAPYIIKETTLKYSIYHEKQQIPLQTNIYKDKEDRIKMVINKGTMLTSYRIGVDIGESKEYQSQIVEVDLDKEPIPPYAEIINVDKAYVIPNEQDPAIGKPEAVGVDLTWQAPSVEELDKLLAKGPLYYELFMNPESKTEVGDALIKIFKVEKDKDGKVIASMYAPETPADVTKVTYNPLKNQFTAQGVQIKKRKELIEAESEKYNWQSLTMKDANYLDKGIYPKLDAIEEKNNLPYMIPKVLYFKMRVIHQIDDPKVENDEKLVRGDKSKEKPLAIDITKNIIPAPENLEAKDISLVNNASQQMEYKGEITFNGVDLEPYIRYMFDPIDIALTPAGYPDLTPEQKKNRRTYEVFVYQEQNQPNLSLDTDIVFEAGKEEEIALSKAVADGKYEGSYIKALRDGKVIRIDKEAYINTYEDTLETEEIKLKLNDLDPNTPYNVVVRVRVERYKNGVNLGPLYSIYTPYVTFTTDTNTLPPVPEDKVPTAPQSFWAVGPTEEKNEIFVHWTESEFVKYQEGEVYYELVRTTDAGLGAGDDPLKSAAELIKYGKVFLVDPNHPNKLIQEYKTTGATPVKPDQPSTTGKVKLPEENKEVQAFTYIDADMFPNTIYYYYVRTVHKVDGKELRSEFVMVPVTTDPVEKPINLKVEDPKDYKYDTTDEVVISFWAPVPQSGVLGKDYDFEVAIQGEDDGKYYTANKFEDDREYRATYKKDEIINQQYKKFTYYVTGLKHGRSYDIRVRIVDKTKPKDAYSAYSDKVRFRTDFDEDEQDKEDKYKEYLEQYDKETEKLKNNPYWLSDSTGNRGIFKYRQAYLGGLLGGNGTYSLETLEFEKDVYYYFPASMAKLIQKNNKMLQVELEDFSAYVRANTFLNNAEIKEAEQYVKEKDIKDYYIGMSFIQSSSKQTIQGNKTVTPEITINMEIIYSDTEDFVVEEDIMIALLELIAKGRERLIKVLDNEMDRGTFREEKVKGFIEDEIKWIQDEHQYEVKRILRAINDG
ncbi:MAG: hypothetical protein ACRDDX_10020, partial [Cellulosilyticaceae bacterium]